MTRAAKYTKRCADILKLLEDKGKLSILEIAQHCSLTSNEVAKLITRLRKEDKVSREKAFLFYPGRGYCYVYNAK